MQLASLIINLMHLGMGCQSFFLVNMQSMGMSHVKIWLANFLGGAYILVEMAHQCFYFIIQNTNPLPNQTLFSW